MKNYIAAAALQSLSSFFIVAILARILTPAEFGKWMLLEPSLLLCAQVGLLGANYGVIKLIASDNFPLSFALDVLLKYVRWTLPLCVISGIGLYYYFVEKNISALAIGFWAFSEGGYLLFVSAFRGANSPEMYFNGVAIRVSLIVSGLLFFRMLGDGQGYKIEELAILWGGATFISSSFLFLKSKTKITCDECPKEKIKNIQRSAFFYGFPILLSAIISAIAANGDRYMLGVLLDAESVGNYAISSKIASILNLIVVPIALWWPTARFKHVNDSDGGDAFFNKVIIQLGFFLGCLSCIIWMLSPYLTEVISPKALFSQKISGYLVASSFFVAISPLISVGLLKDGNTRWLPISMLISICCQVVFTILAANKWRAEGVACVVMITSMIGMFLQHAISNRLQVIKWQYKKIGVVLLALVFCLSIAKYVTENIFIEVIVFTALAFICCGMNKKEFWPVFYK